MIVYLFFSVKQNTFPLGNTLPICPQNIVHTSWKSWKKLSIIFFFSLLPTTIFHYFGIIVSWCLFTRNVWNFHYFLYLTFPCLFKWNYDLRCLEPSSRVSFPCPGGCKSSLYKWSLFCLLGLVWLWALNFREFLHNFYFDLQQVSWYKFLWHNYYALSYYALDWKSSFNFTFFLNFNLIAKLNFIYWNVHFHYIT